MEWLRYLNQYCPPYLLDVIRLSIWLLLLTIIFLPLERLFALHPQQIFRKETLSDLGYYFLNGILPGILLSVPLAVLASAAHRFLPDSYTSAVAAWPTWGRIAAALVIGEIGFYWGHRWSHQIPLLWRFHSIHHGPRNMYWLISSRAHPVDLVFTRLCGLTLLFMTGLAVPMAGSGTIIPALVVLLGTVWGFFIHANVNWRFGPLEWLVATPTFHHWHHTNDGPEYINKNYAPMLPWVDRIFGTMYLPKSRPTRYGTDYPISPHLFAQLLQPFDFADATLRPSSQESVKELPALGENR